ncbi:MAG: thioredoxin [Chloroflexi bacterium]|nr:thioredoxin [Chloroflexota bacterium]
MPFLQDILPEPVDAIAGTGAQAAPQVNEGAGQTTFEVTTTNFESEVLNSDQPVLVDFSAEWCGPCRAIAPIVDELATEYTGTMKVGKLDIDQQTDLAVRYDITSIPTLILFKGGEPVARIIGQRPKDEIVSELVPHLD